MKVKKFLALFIFLILVGFFPARPVATGAPATLLVKLRPGAGAQQLAFYGDPTPLVFDGLYRVHVADRDEALRELKAQPWVQYVETDGILQTSAIASDPLFVLDQKEITKQWYLPKIDIHHAWDKTVGSGITIAILDTGIDAKHEDLSDGRVIGGYASYCQVMAQNSSNDCLIRITGELAPGVNSDDNGHGTIVAGIIGAIPNNDKGMAGIDWNVRLMPIKALDSTGTGLTSDVAVGIKWAVDHGARIINLSIGGQGLQGVDVLQEAISYAFNKGVLIVAAAGNDAAVDGENLNTNPVLPACADGGQNMIIGVAATDMNDVKARFSNYGSNCVDIAAPGTGTFFDKDNKHGLVSTYYDPTRPGEQNLYVYALGTSVAAPMVSGVAGLMMSVFPDLDVKAIRDRLLSSVDNIDQYNSTGCGGASCIGQIGRGRLNAFKAVNTVDSFGAGTLVRGPDGGIFLIERGLKRPISDVVFKERFGGSTMVSATTEQLNALPTGTPVPPADGTLIKEPANPTVYLVEGGDRHALSYLAFSSRNFHFEDVVTLTAAELAWYPSGADDPVLNGALLKLPYSPAVFILQNGTRQLLSYFVFQARGFDKRVIAVVSDQDLLQYPLEPHGYLYPPADGTLIKGGDDQTVYVIQGGKRLGLTLIAFQNRWFRFSDVAVLPQSEVDGYQAGPAILQ